ncbi:choline monooxygenase [Microdochium nivale]|nr:choline monooxygenase [Microdochium nivale]
MLELVTTNWPRLVALTLSASVLGVVLSYFTSFTKFFVPSPSKEECSKNAVRALPGSWYISDEMYQLERRAIFSKRWLLTTHKARLPNNGDWLRYEVAGYSFIIARDRTGAINAFHNVCRHRAYPVVTADKGNNSILACKYHNWSYALNGKLTKAPEYQELEGFDKSKNGLFPIHVHIDHNDFIWVNLEAKEKPTIAWNADYDRIDEQARYKAYNFDDYVFDHTWEMAGDYNWKILADNYNECYHCPTTHPDIPTVADLEAYSVKTDKAYIQHLGAPTAEQIAKGFNVSATYFFPNASMNVSPHFFFMQRFVPKGPNKSVMSYEVYRNKHSTDEQFNTINDIYKRIMSEDKHLCAAAQENINAGIFVNGELHPRLEQGPLFFQNVIRESVMSHHKAEQKAKQEIWPARQVMPGNKAGQVSEKDLGLCSSLEASCSMGRPDLEW